MKYSIVFSSFILFLFSCDPPTWKKLQAVNGLQGIYKSTKYLNKLTGQSFFLDKPLILAFKDSLGTTSRANEMDILNEDSTIQYRNNLVINQSLTILKDYKSTLFIDLNEIGSDKICSFRINFVSGYTLNNKYIGKYEASAIMPGPYNSKNDTLTYYFDKIN